MSSEGSRELATSSLTYEAHLDVEQRIAILLNKFSDHLQTKTKEQLLDIRIDLMQRYHEQYLDNQMVKLCLQMIHVVDKQLRRLYGG